MARSFTAAFVTYEDLRRVFNSHRKPTIKKATKDGDARDGVGVDVAKPLTKITWDNAALVSPAAAERLGLGYNIGSKGGVAYADVVELSFRGCAVLAPAWSVPGHADDSITVHLGYGRRRARYTFFGSCACCLRPRVLG